MQKFFQALGQEHLGSPPLGTESARREYMVRVIIGMMMLVLPIAMLPIIVGYWANVFDIYPILIVSGLGALVGVGWWFVLHGRWEWSANLLIGIFLALGFYITSVNGLEGNSGLTYVTAVFLTAMFYGIRTQWIILLVAFATDLAIGLGVSLPTLDALGEIIIPRVAMFTGLALLQSFALRLLEQALQQARTAVNESHQANEHLRQENIERQKLIAELEAKNKELERFTYTVSHDLKAPIITIRGFLGFLEKDALAGDTERMTADISRIIEATDKMHRLLNELLELSRIGRMMNPPENVPFEDLVNEALSLVRGRLDANQVRVTVGKNLPTVRGDKARLTEVVQNLIDNAAKFMGNQPNPHIEIGTRGATQEGKPIFFVRDNGIGIDVKYHDKVFGLFNKLDAQSEGTGIGLALVKRIVEVHGGTIWVESELGKGATFCFSLAPKERQP